MTEKKLDRSMILENPKDDFLTTQVGSVNDPSGNILLSTRIHDSSVPGDAYNGESDPAITEIPANQPSDIKLGGSAESASSVSEGGALAFSAKNLQGGALAFNEEELERQFRALKKGSKLGSGPLAAAAITTLINAAPAIISALKGKQGSGESAPDTEDLLKLMKQIQNQKKYIKNGEIGSGKLGDFFSNAWKKVKGFYNNNKELLQPIMNSLGDYAKDSAQKYINKGADYLASKTDNEHLKKAIDTTKNIATDIKNDVVDNVVGPKVVGSGVQLPDNDFDDLNELAETIEANKNVIKKKATSNKLQTVPGFAMSQTSIKPKGFKRIRTNNVFI